MEDVDAVMAAIWGDVDMETKVPTIVFIAARTIIHQINVGTSLINLSELRLILHLHLL